MDAKFSILARGRSDYHLAVLEAIFILARPLYFAAKRNSF